MDLAKEAFESAQAALLNSQCSPQETVRQALRAVAMALCEAAWKEYPELE